MKNLILTLFFVSLISCGDVSQKNFETSEMNHPIGRWESLPIGLKIENDLQAEVVDVFNEIFGDVFFFDENGLEISDFEFENPNIFGFTFWTSGAQGYMNKANVLIKEGLQDGLYKKILAHELFHVLGFGHIEKTLMSKITSPFNADIRKKVSDQILVDAFYELYPEEK